MQATIDPAKPIWDQYVLQNLGLELTGTTQEEKLKNAMLCYAFKVLRQRNYQDVGMEDFAHVQDRLAEILSRGISQQVKQGLYRSYTSIEEQTKTLCGKINLYG